MSPKQRPKYTKSKELPCTGKEHAQSLARLLTYYAKDVEKENIRHAKALQKLQTKMNRIEKMIRDMGDEAFSDEIIMEVV